MAHEVDSPNWWDDRYATGGDGWELGGPAPPLLRLLREAPPPKGRVAVPGCGRGHDVELWAKAGFDAVGFDFAGRAVEEARRAGRHVLQRDVFALGREFAGAFDVVWEYTCYCAIDPSRRTEYAGVLGEILRPGGELVALFYPVGEKAGGPPFAVKRDEIARVLEPRFEIASIEAPSDSIERRRGAELLVRARRRSSQSSSSS